MGKDQTSDQLHWMRVLNPIQRQILSDLCRGAQVVRCHDEIFRACIDISGRSRLSIYALNTAAMTRLCAVVPEIKIGYYDPDPSSKDLPPEGYGFFYLPANSRLAVGELLTLTIRAPRDAFFTDGAQAESAKDVPLDLTPGYAEPTAHSRCVTGA